MEMGRCLYCIWKHMHVLDWVHGHEMRAGLPCWCLVLQHHQWCCTQLQDPGVRKRNEGSCTFRNYGLYCAICVVITSLTSREMISPRLTYTCDYVTLKWCSQLQLVYSYIPCAW